MPLEIVQPRVSVDDVTRKRSKALFGHLVGHLQKAKKRLESERETRASERHQEMEAKIAEKLQKEKQAHKDATLKKLKVNHAWMHTRSQRVCLPLYPCTHL